MPLLARSVGIGPGFFPHPAGLCGATHRRTATSTPGPIRRRHSAAAAGARSPPRQPCSTQRWNRRCTVEPDPYSRGHGLPLTARAEHVQDAVEDAPWVDPCGAHRVAPQFLDRQQHVERCASTSRPGRATPSVRPLRAAALAATAIPSSAPSLMRRAVGVVLHGRSQGSSVESRYGIGSYPAAVR